MNKLTSFSVRNDSGFTLIELLMYFVVLGILMGIVFNSFQDNLFVNTRQSGIAQTKIETGIGIDLLRTDLEHAGFGLPWNFPSNITYTEAAQLSGASDAPCAYSSEESSALSINNSDYLVIRGSNMALSTAAQSWGIVGRLGGAGTHAVAVQSMGDNTFANKDYVIVLRPVNGSGELRELIMNGNNFSTQVTGAANPFSLLSDAFAPAETANDPDGEKYLIYGINNASIRRPFNRSDYYIKAYATKPNHCAPNTGVLVKAVENQADDNFSALNTADIADCVADFQVVYYLDTDDDGGWDRRVDANGLSGFTAATIRSQVKAVHCYILTHEGSKDQKFTYSNTTINVGELTTNGLALVVDSGVTLGRAFDLSATIGGDWAHYRWKVYSLAITPTNLN